MNTNPNTTTVRLSPDTIASVVESLLTDDDYSTPAMHLSDRIDATIAILTTLGYSFSSAVTASGTAIYGHTNGNFYTMVSPHHDLHGIVYLARSTGRVSL